MPICPCGCAASTSRLFAPGHDQRYKGMLRTAFKAALDVQWGMMSDEFVSVDEAVDRIAAAIGSDWSDVPSGGKPRPANAPRASRPASTPSSASVTPSSPVETTLPTPCQDRRSARKPVRGTRRDPIARSARIDGLMDRLTSRGPVAGQWGWWRPKAAPDQRFAAQVRKTRRDNGDSSLDLFVPDGITKGRDALITGVDPDSFFVDHMAKP